MTRARRRPRGALLPGTLPTVLLGALVLAPGLAFAQTLVAPTPPAVSVITPDTGPIIATPLPPPPGMTAAPPASPPSPPAPIAAAPIAATPGASTAGASPPGAAAPALSPGAPPGAPDQAAAKGPVVPSPAPPAAASAALPGAPGLATPAAPGPGAAQPPQALATVVDPGTPLSTAWLPRPVAELRILDKQTAIATELSVPVGQSARIGPLTVAVRACVVRPPDQPGDAAAFLDIVGGAAPFREWTLRGEPSLGIFQDPTYAIRLRGCRA